MCCFIVVVIVILFIIFVIILSGGGQVANNGNNIKEISDQKHKNEMTYNRNQCLTQEEEIIVQEMEFVFCCLIKIMQKIMNDKSKRVNGYDSGGYICCSCGIFQNQSYVSLNANIMGNDILSVHEIFDVEKRQKFEELVSITPFNGIETYMVSFRYYYYRELQHENVKLIFDELKTRMTNYSSKVRTKEMGHGENHGWKFTVEFKCKE